MGMNSNGAPNTPTGCLLKNYNDSPSPRQKVAIVRMGRFEKGFPEDISTKAGASYAIQCLRPRWVSNNKDNPDSVFLVAKVFCCRWNKAGEPEMASIPNKYRRGITVGQLKYACSSFSKVSYEYNKPKDNADTRHTEPKLVDTKKNDNDILKLERPSFY
jgi:hypothetical protein